MTWNGYAGRILVIDLSNDRISVENLKRENVTQFIGGFGMNLKLGADLIKPNINPLSPENVIIIGAGPLVGTITPGSSRIVAFTKFPASGAIANSCGSMSFGFQLKQSGYDHIIIKGKSNTPVYLSIMDDSVNLEKANNLWGKDIVQTTDILWKNNNCCGVIAIGQAGENLVKSSMTLIDKTSTFGRGGLGAVMGSKNLKAIIAKGTRGVTIAQPKEFNKLYNHLLERIRNYPQRQSWIDLGMLRSLPVGMLLSAKGQKKKARQCSERVYLKKLKHRRFACPSCPMADKDILKLKEEPELISYCSSVINPFLMFTLDALTKNSEALLAFDKINRYGLDSLTITSLFDFISQIYKQGFLNEDNFGPWEEDFNFLMELIEKITFRKGIGDYLADGWKKFAEKHEFLADKMPVVKGLDVIFEPRLMKLGTMEFEQIVNPKGSHVASGGSPTYVGASGSLDKFRNHFARMGIPESAMNRIFEPPLKDMGVHIGRLTRYSEDWYSVLTSLGLCARAQMNRFWSLKLTTEFYNAITGMDVNPENIRTSAERSWNLLKLMNIKEGFSGADDSFPKEWFKPLKIGDTELKLQNYSGGVEITVEIARQLLEDYYDERGWDKIKGIPTQEKLSELNLNNY